jgi:probable HAF family extracellular repeat protein
MTNLGTLGGTYSSAADINDNGQVVGVTGGGLFGRDGAFVWQDGTMTLLDTADGANAVAINNSGQIAGEISGSAGTIVALWDKNTRTLMEAPESLYYAHDINEHTAVVGYRYSDRAFIWQNGVVTFLPLLENSNGGGSYLNRANAINDNGVVVGDATIGIETSSGSAPVEVPVVWQNGIPQRLGTSSGNALGINNAGQIVGTNFDAMLWQNGQTIHLDSLLPMGSAWDLKVAHDINERGQIVGLGVYNGKQRAFLMTPVAPAQFEAEDCQPQAPFAVSNGLVSQSVETTDPTKGGALRCSFTVPAAGEYIVKAVVRAPSTAANSFFVNIDAEPSAPTMIWDIPIATSLREQVASWRGTGTVDRNQFTPKIWNLAAGQHQLIVRGREAGVQIDRIVVERLSPLEIPADFGTVQSPFRALRGSVSQTVETTNPAQGGRASYHFNAPVPGTYEVDMVVYAPTTANNSLFVNIDAEPTAPTMIWDIPTTSEFTRRTVSWRGTGGVDTPQFAPKRWTLAAGQHELIVRGREANTSFSRIILRRVGN